MKWYNTPRMKNKNLDTLRSYRRWFSGRGAKYQSCLPPSISVEDVRNSFDAACDALSLRLSVAEFAALTNGAQTSLDRFTKNKSDILKGMDGKDADEFTEFVSVLRQSISHANRILRTLKKNGRGE